MTTPVQPCPGGTATDIEFLCWWKGRKHCGVHIYRDWMKSTTVPRMTARTWGWNSACVDRFDYENVHAAILVLSFVLQDRQRCLYTRQLRAVFGESYSSHRTSYRRTVCCDNSIVFIFMISILPLTDPFWIFIWPVSCCCAWRLCCNAMVIPTNINRVMRNDAFILFSSKVPIIGSWQQLHNPILQVGDRLSIYCGSLVSKFD